MKPIAPELAAQIQRRIDELYAPDSLGYWPTRVCKHELNALPLHGNWITCGRCGLMGRCCAWITNRSIIRPSRQPTPSLSMPSSFRAPSATRSYRSWCRLARKAPSRVPIAGQPVWSQAGPKHTNAVWGVSGWDGPARGVDARVIEGKLSIFQARPLARFARATAA